MNILVFQLKTKTDTDAGRQLYGQVAEMAQLNDKDVKRVMLLQQRLHHADKQDESLPLHLQSIDSISISSCINQQWSLQHFDTAQSSELEVLQQVYHFLGHNPVDTLVSWQTQAWLLPFLLQRHLRYAKTLRNVPPVLPIIDLAANLKLDDNPAVLNEMSKLLGFPYLSDAVSKQQQSKFSVLQIHRLFLHHIFSAQKIAVDVFERHDTHLHQQMKSICMNP